MIKKLICKIWGHNFFQDVFTGNYGKAFHPLYSITVTVPIMRKERLSYCTRCGNK
jgi:hypothetical protein